MRSILLAQTSIAVVQFGFELLAVVGVHQSLRHKRVLRRVLHPHHDAAVHGRNLQSHVHLGGSSAAHHDRQVKPRVLHLCSHVHHLLQTRRYKSAQSDHVNLFSHSLLHNLLCRHHHSEVNHLVVVTRHNHIYNVLADVVHVALHGSHEHLASCRCAFLLVSLDVRLQYRHRLLHGARCLYDLRQEHFATTEEFAHLVHARHERTLYYVHRLRIHRKCLLQVILHIVGYTFHESRRQALSHISLAPLRLGSRSCCRTRCYTVLQCLLLQLYLLCEINKTLRSVGASIEHHVLKNLELVGRNVAVSHLRSRIDDAEVHALAYGVIEEHGMHRLAYVVVATEREREVAHTTADMRSGQVRANPLRSANEVERIVVVLAHAGSYGKHVRVEDDVERVHAHLLREQTICTLGYLDASLICGSLSLLVEAHHHDRGTVAHHVAGMTEEHLLAFLQRDRVDYRLALHTLQSGCDYVPF